MAAARLLLFQENVEIRGQHYRKMKLHYIVYVNTIEMAEETLNVRKGLHKPNLHKLHTSSLTCLTFCTSSSTPTARHGFVWYL